MDSNLNEFPKCHFCDRYAFEIAYEDLPICEECMTNMSSNKVWHLIRTMNGDLFVTSVEQLMDYEVLSEGTFKEMWNLCQEMDGQP